VVSLRDELKQVRAQVRLTSRNRDLTTLRASQPKAPTTCPFGRASEVRCPTPMTVTPAQPAELVERRDYLYRLSPDRWLAALEEAHTFVLEWRMLTLTPGCNRRSLVDAGPSSRYPPPCYPSPRGFAARPPIDNLVRQGTLREAAPGRLAPRA
jgi:hypothetical protein